MSNLATIVNNILADSGIDDINVVVTNGSYSNPAWITALSWSKITGTPTTLGGYGITDAVPSSRTLTINGVSYDLSANRSWNIVSDVTSINAGTGISVNQTTGAVTITNTGVLSINGSTGAVTGIITTSNYNNYSPTLTGGGASGIWGINITGDANTLDGYHESAFMRYYGYSTSGNFQTFQATTGVLRFDQVGALNDGGWTNQPTGIYAYGGVLSYRGANFGLQIYASHTGGMVYKTQWNDDQYSGWLRILDTQNYASFAVQATNQSNWNSYSVLANVVGLLAWKNYGNGHVIFDASNGTSPSGGGVSQVNATYPWAASYPTLMGWNGSNTYGVRVDSARISDNTSGNADTVDGYHATNAAGGLAYYAGNGYLYAPAWINVDNGGIFSSTNNAHFTPNNGTYGSWQILGSKNNYRGIEFGSGSNGNVALMISNDSNVSGFYNVSYGWQILWQNGTFYVFKNAYGGGTQATVLDSSNYNSWAASVGGNTGNSFGVFELTYASTAFNPSLAPRTGLNPMSIKMWNNYFNGTGLGSDYGTVMEYYSLSAHVDTQVYYDASGSSWYRTAYYASGWGSWQRYLTDANYTSYAVPISGYTFGTAFSLGTMFASTGIQGTNLDYMIGVYTNGYIYRFTSGAVASWIGLGSYLPLSGGTLTGTLFFSNNIGTAIQGTMGNNDFWRIYATGGDNAGYLEIATADDGAEPIYISQYSGVFTTLTRRITLLDGSGNTTFPGTVNVSGGINVTGNSSWFAGQANIALENQSTFARFAFYGLSLWDWDHGEQMVLNGNYVYVSNYLQAGNSLRAPIFYDSVEPTYYLDPNGYSQLQTVGLGAYVQYGTSVGGPSANFGNGRIYLRVWPTGSGSRIMSFKLMISTTWNYAPGFGFITAEVSFYFDGTNLNYPVATITSATGYARVNLNIGTPVIENGYISVPIYSVNTNAIYAKLEGSPSFDWNSVSWGGWESVGFPGAAVVNVPGDMNIAGTLGVTGNITMGGATVATQDWTGGFLHQGSGGAFANLDTNKDSRYVTFDQSSPTGAPAADWFNGFVSTHANYLSSYIINQHRTGNWYLGWRDGTTALSTTWRLILHSGNYNSYAPTLTGGGASGTWGISITGNSDTVDGYHAYYFAKQDYYNVGYDWNTIGAQDQGTAIILRVEGAATNPPAGDVYNWSLYQQGNSVRGSQLALSAYGAQKMFFRSANYDTGSYKSWSEIIHSDNYTNYTVTKTGTGASGTWGINITGSAETIDGIDSTRIVFGDNANKTLNRDNASINVALPSGFYDGYGMTGAPSPNTYYHLIVNRHVNVSNNYQMQIAGEFFNSNALYYRIISNDTPSAWNLILHSGNQPYAYNMNQYVRTSDAVTFAGIYNNEWFRNYNVNQGLYNQATTQHWSSKDNGYWDASSTNTVSSIRFFTGGHINTLRGYIYANSSNEIGLLNEDGNWNIRTWNRAQELYGTTYVNDLRPNVIYDRADATYYMDLNGGSYLRGLVTVTGGHYNSAINVILRADENGAGEGQVTLRAWCSEPGVTWSWAGFGYNVINDGTAPYGFGRYNANFGQAYMRFSTSGQLRFYNMNTSGTRVETAIFAETGAITFNYSVTAQSFFEGSDMRIKELIEDNYRANDIHLIKPKLYKKNGKVELGYYAQEVQPILQHAITIDENGYLGLSYREVHTAKIAYLEDSIEEIKAKILYLENQLKTKQ